MKRTWFLKLLFLAAFLGCGKGVVQSQVLVYEDFVPSARFIYLKERFFYAQIHTAGFTIGYEQGHLNSRFNYMGWNIEFATQLDYRAKAVNWYGSGRRYKFGMLNSFCILRAGYGGLWTLNEKPYWGGVKVSLSYRGGFSLGLAFPQYINVLYDTAGQDLRLERMDPENPRHRDVAYILERGPILKGLSGMRPYPGIFLKVGMDFEFGKSEERSHTLGFGIIYDCYFTRIPLMMDQKNPFGFLNFYIEYKFGKRHEAR